MRRLCVPGFLVCAVWVSALPTAAAQYQEEQIVLAASDVLREAMGNALTPIPQAMLANSHGVAIIPNVLKGGFIIGARHGRGLLFVREADGIWHAPVFLTLTGGNIGWQAGLQASDLILVFKSPQSVQGILAGKLTIGADAAAAAGPLGRQGAIATDGQLRAEIYSYSRSRGLFAGVSIDGSMLQIDPVAGAQYYRSPGPGQPVIVPPAAQQLTQTIAAYAGGPEVLPTAFQQDSLIHQHRSADVDFVRHQLGQALPRLYSVVGEAWQQYLRVPNEMLTTGNLPQPAQVRDVLDRFNVVANDRQYQALSARPEFQAVHGLLRQFQQTQQASNQPLDLPPPPGRPGSAEAK